MKPRLLKTFGLFLLFFSLTSGLYAQPPQLTVLPGYTACPCQTINITATWNNVSSITYTLLQPGQPPISFATNTFPFYSCTLGNSTSTLIGAGTYTGSPITSTALIYMTVNSPSPLTLTNTINYCYGTPATIIAPIGGTAYVLSPPSPPNVTYPSNVMNIPNPVSGTYTVTSVIAGCTVTGTTPMNISPNVNVSINTPSSVCQGIGCVTLTCSLANAASYQWYDNFNTAIAGPAGTSASLSICNLAVNQGGVYGVTVQESFAGGTVLCPHSATTTINVVATSPVNVAASPANVICQGTSLNLSANAGGATSFSWSGPQSFSSNSPNPVISPAIPANSGNYTATALFVSSFLTCSTSAVVNVSIVPVAMPVITMPPNACQNTSFVITATAGANPIAYNWAGPAFPGGSAVGASIPINSVQPNASGTQFVTALFAIGSTQCISTTSAQLNVVPVNTVTVIPPGPICSPTNAFLQALATGANLYQWKGPNGFSTPGANVFVYYPTPAASGIYTVTASFGSGSSLVCTSSNTLALTVYPVLQFSLVPRQQACEGAPIKIEGPSGATSYTWTSSTGFTSNDKDIIIPSAKFGHNGTYTLNVSLGPCNSSASSEIVILSRIQLTLTPQNRTVCSGDTIILEAGATGGSENYAYQWYPSIYLSSNNGPKQIAIPLGSVQYNLKVHDIACPDYPQIYAFDVNVNQPPKPQLNLEKTQGCQPLCLLYNSHTQSEAFVTTYDFGGNLVFQKDSFNYCLKDAGTYTLTIYSKGNNGCSGKYTFPYPLIVDPSPGSDFTWSPEIPSTIDPITFTPTNKGPITHRTWSFIGGVVPGDTSKLTNSDDLDTTNIENPIRLYSKHDSYPVLLVTSNDNGCKDSVMYYVKVIDNFQIFVPNTFTPNGDGINDLFYAKGTGMKEENFSMEIFNRGGLLVFSTKDINEGWDGKMKGQVCKDAVYIYKIKAVGMNGEGRKEFTGYVTLLK